MVLRNIYWILKNIKVWCSRNFKKGIEVKNTQKEKFLIFHSIKGLLLNIWSKTRIVFAYLDILDRKGIICQRLPKIFSANIVIYNQSFYWSKTDLDWTIHGFFYNVQNIWQIKRPGSLSSVKFNYKLGYKPRDLL